MDLHRSACQGFFLYFPFCMELLENACPLATTAREEKTWTSGPIDSQPFTVCVCLNGAIAESEPFRDIRGERKR